MARPIEFTETRIAEINALMEKYTEETYIPKVAEFAYIHNIRRQALYEHEGLSDNLKRMLEKKEANLENDGLDKGKFTPMHA